MTHDEKNAARSAIRTKVATIGESQWRQASEQACALAFALPSLQRARVIMLTLSLPDELDTTPLILACLRAGQRVAVPRVDTESHSLTPIEIRDIEADTAPGYRGVREPITECVVALDEIDWIVVPGVGFDRSGARLGRGAGYYDRFLSSAQMRATRCGLAHAAQLVDAIPTESHDVAMDMIVTNEQVIRIRPSS